MSLNFLQQIALWILPFLALITVIVTIHELGHYLVARLFGTAIERFSIGFGKALVSYRAKNGTVWQISAIPLGGYVKFAGDANAASVPDADDLAAMKREVVANEGPAALKRYFHFKPIWQRALVVAAGPFANFVLAVVAFALVAFLFLQQHVPPVVDVVLPNSPAAHAGIVPGDVIKTVDGHAIDEFDDVRRTIVFRAGEPVIFTLQRGGRTLDATVTPARRMQKDQDSGATVPQVLIGVAHTNAKDITFTRRGPAEAVAFGFHQTTQTLQLTLHYLGRLVTGREKGDQLSGAIGMAGATKGVAAAALRESHTPGDAAANLLGNMLQMIAMVSVGIGFVNLLPVPVLDGGHLLFYGYEAVARRPLSARVQEVGYRVGFALLICLVLFSAFNDLSHFGVFRFVGGLFS